MLGSEENRNLLVHFLNAILTGDLSAPITEAEILNPYNDKEFLDDKLSVVDVKAKDSEGRLYQIEIQLLTYRHLPERMVYTWCDIISQQLQSGNDYSLLKPVYSIWLLAENLLPGEANYAHEYTAFSMSISYLFIYANVGKGLPTYCVTRTVGRQPFAANDFKT